MSNGKCTQCGSKAKYNQALCWSCQSDIDQQEEYEKFEARSDVMMLNEVSDLEELKNWIKEHLIK